MITPNSRYAQSPIVAVNKDGQVANVIVASQQTAKTFSYVSHMMTDNDRLDNLANQYYGDPTAWWQIANANPELIDWSSIPPGTVLRIPYS